MSAIMLANLTLLPFRHAFVTAHSSIWPVCVDGPDASKASGDGLQYVCERIRARGGLAIRNWSESHVMESRQSCNRKTSTKVMTQKRRGSHSFSDDSDCRYCRDLFQPLSLSPFLPLCSVSSLLSPLPLCLSLSLSLYVSMSLSDLSLSVYFCFSVCL